MIGELVRYMVTFEISLEPAPAAATTGRTEVTERLAASLGSSMLEDVRLLVTELITNALRHGKLIPGDRVSVKASVDEGVVRIEVTDPGRDGEVEPREPGARGGGYGLYMVDQLSQRWGVESNEGTTVWCELSPDPAR